MGYFVQFSVFETTKEPAPDCISKNFLTDFFLVIKLRAGKGYFVISDIKKSRMAYSK